MLILQNFPVVSVQSVRFSAHVGAQGPQHFGQRSEGSGVGWLNQRHVDRDRQRRNDHHQQGHRQLRHSGAPWPHRSTASPAGSSGTAGDEIGPQRTCTRRSKGAQNAAGVFCDLRIHAEELTGFQIDPARGYLIRSIVSTDPDFVLPYDPIWPRGLLNFRVQYTAGYVTIPEGRAGSLCRQWRPLLPPGRPGDCWDADTHERRQTAHAVAIKNGGKLRSMNGEDRTRF